MAERPQILICSCEDTMPLDADAVRRGCRGAQVTTAHHLCRAEIDRFRAAVGEGEPLIVGCTQEAPLFSEVAEEQESSAPLTFVNVRETAGWSDRGRRRRAENGRADRGRRRAGAGFSAGQPVERRRHAGLRPRRARDRGRKAARRPSRRHGADQPPEGSGAAARDRISGGQGHDPLRARAISARSNSPSTIMRRPLPSSRGALSFGPARNGAVSRCDLVLDLSGGAPLFPAHDLRDGYLRADPADPAAVLTAVLKARDLVGGFDKPRYITFTEDLCAHSRSKIVGCRRCLDLCPTGAIAPAGDHVAIDPNICAGCGQCAAVCPTGAAAYALPPADTLLRKLRAMLTAYREAGGARAIVLLHDEPHGAPLIDALARHGDGLPANVLPLAVNEVTQVGLEAVAAAFAYGACGLRFLTRAKPRHDIAGLHQDDRARRADPCRPRLRRGPRRHHRDRRSVRARRNAARDRARRRRAAPGRVPARRRKARRAAACVARTASCGARAGRYRGAARRRAVRHGRAQCRGLHALPLLRVRLPDRRAVGRSGAPGAALRRGCLRAMRAVQGDLPGESHHAEAAARLPRRDRAGARAEGRGAVLLHPLRQAVRREELGRARRRQARRQALDVPEFGEAPRRHQDVRRLPRDRDDGGELRSVRRAGAAQSAHHGRLSARAERRRRGASEALELGLLRPLALFAPCQKIRQRLAILLPSRCAAPASWCPACRPSGPISNSFATVSGVHTMSSFFSASEKL